MELKVFIFLLQIVLFVVIAMVNSAALTQDSISDTLLWTPREWIYVPQEDSSTCQMNFNKLMKEKEILTSAYTVELQATHEKLLTTISTISTLALDSNNLIKRILKSEDKAEQIAIKLQEKTKENQNLIRNLEDNCTQEKGKLNTEILNLKNRMITLENESKKLQREGEVKFEAKSSLTQRELEGKIKELQDEKKNTETFVQKLKIHLGLVNLGTCTYYFSSEHETLTWSDSLNFCRSRGLQLVSIEDKSESDQILDHITNTLGMEEYTFWIGGTDVNHEGHFTWSGTGRPFNFTLWDLTEPNNGHAGGEHCVEIWFPSWNQVVKKHEPQFPSWNDIACSHKRRFICEL